MQSPETKAPTPVGGVVALVGGALLVIGSFQEWAEVSGTGTRVAATGTEGTDGWITLVAGVLVLAAGASMMRRASVRGAAILAIVAGLVGGGVGLYDALTATDSFLDSAAEDIAREFGGSVEQLRALLDAAIRVGELAVTVSIGLYLVIAGGAVAVLGGAISLVRRSPEPTPAQAVLPTPEAETLPPSPGVWASPPAPAASEPWATVPPAAPTPGGPGEIPPAPMGQPTEQTGALPPPSPPATAAPLAEPAASDLEPTPGAEVGSSPEPRTEPAGASAESPPEPWPAQERADRAEAGSDEEDR